MSKCSSTLNRIGWMLLCCFSPLLSLGQQDTTKTEIESQIDQLLEYSVEDLLSLTGSSASKITQKVNEAPGIITIIPRKITQTFQWMSVNDITFKQAGFAPAQDRFNKVINSRGISDLLWSKRLLVLVDGVPFSSFQSTVTDEAFSISMAKSVEVVRGPGAVLYGSQAVTGMIQVNTLSYVDLDGIGEIEFRGGNNEYRYVNVITGADGKRFSTLVSFNSYTTNGNEYESYDALLSRDKQGNFKRVRTQDERQSHHFFGKLEGKDKLKGLSLTYHLQDYHFQLGHGFLTIHPEIEKTSSVSRHYAMLKYVTPQNYKRLIQEYVLKYDYEVSDFDMQIAPVGFKRKLNTGQNDSSGVYERYITPITGGFARYQVTKYFNKDATLLGGIEQNMTFYNGDNLHVSNVNLGEPGFIPFPNSEIREVGPLYESIKGHPVSTSSLFVQGTSGSILGKKLTATLGGRYDFYYYNHTNLSDRKDTLRKAGHFSPRAGLVYKISEDFTLKALYGHAFRLASPFEQFVSNSLVTGQSSRVLKPEVINTYELSSDWTIMNNINWRNTLFHSKFEDQITSLFSFKNLINTTQQGFETEVQFDLDDFIAFANYTYTRRTNETSDDKIIVPSNTLIWYPSNVINAGISYNVKKGGISIQGHYQGEVDRRSTEKGAPLTGANTGINYNLLRGEKVAAWKTIDLSAFYNLRKYLELRLTSTNLFNERYFLVNNLAGRTPLPFDYQQAGRRIVFSLRLKI